MGKMRVVVNSHLITTRLNQRRAIGLELDEAYCKLAAERIVEAIGLF
jgi:DNA modification methylase